MCHCIAYVKNYELMGITSWSVKVDMGELIGIGSQR